MSLAHPLAAERGLLRPLALTLVAADRLAGWLIIGFLSMMVIVVSAQVALRYGLNSSMGFADELSRLCFVWSIFLAIPLGIRLGAHIGMELLTARLPVRLAHDYLPRLTAVIAAGMMLLVGWQSAVVAFDQWDETMASINASAAWFIVAVAASAFHAALHLVWIALKGKPEQTMMVATE